MGRLVSGSAAQTQTRLWFGGSDADSSLDRRLEFIKGMVVGPFTSRRAMPMLKDPKP